MDSTTFRDLIDYVRIPSTQFSYHRVKAYREIQETYGVRLSDRDAVVQHMHLMTTSIFQSESPYSKYIESVLTSYISMVVSGRKSPGLREYFANVFNTLIENTPYFNDNHLIHKFDPLTPIQAIEFEIPLINGGCTLIGGKWSFHDDYHENLKPTDLISGASSLLLTLVKSSDLCFVPFLRYEDLDNLNLVTPLESLYASINKSIRFIENNFTQFVEEHSSEDDSTDGNPYITFLFDQVTKYNIPGDLYSLFYVLMSMYTNLPLLDDYQPKEDAKIAEEQPETVEPEPVNVSANVETVDAHDFVNSYDQPVEVDPPTDYPTGYEPVEVVLTDEDFVGVDEPKYADQV